MDNACSINPSVNRIVGFVYLVGYTKQTTNKKKTNKSHSSTDKSITNDSSSDSENESDEDEPIDVKSKNDFAQGKCLISIKKKE